LSPPDGFSHQGFGASVAVSGNLALVVSRSERDTKDDEDGYARSLDMFDLTRGTRTGLLVPLSNIRLKYYWRVSADGRWAAIAAYSEKPCEAYVFDLKTGKQQAVLKPDDDLSPGELFGSSISLKGDRVIVGAQGFKPHSDSDGPGGAAYVFDVESGKQTRKLVSKDARYEDCFGHSVALSDSYAVIGAPLTDVGGREDAGAVYVFDRRTGKHFILRAPHPTASEVFGNAVAVCGDVAVIGGPKDTTATRDPGSAYVYNLHTGQMLAELRSAESSAGDCFGVSVGISDRLIVVGAPHDDSEAGKDTGAAYAFDRATGKELARLTAKDLRPGTIFTGGSEIGGAFGLSLAVTEDWIAVCAPNADTNTTSETGAVYIFRATDIYSKHPDSQPSGR